MKKTNNEIINEIKQHQERATEAATFGELAAILKTDGEIMDKLALAFTLGYMRGSEKREEA